MSQAAQTRGQAEAQPEGMFWLTLPALVPTVVVYLFPLLLLARYSLNRFVPGKFMVEALTVRNYVSVATDPYYRSVLLTTIAIAMSVTILSVIIALPLAHFMARTVRFKKVLVLLVLIPLFVGNAVRAAGWMLAFSEKGLVNSVLTTLHLASHPAAIMFTPTAVLIGCISVSVPFVALTVQSVLEGIKPSVEEAAQSLGATPFESFRLVTLPLAMPGIRAATVLSFILGMNAYATPVLLGGPSFQMMAPVIANEVLAKNDFPIGATLSFILILMTLGLTWGFGRLGRGGAVA